MATVYILFSKSLQVFYTGVTTISVEQRLQNHLNEYYENKFTHKAKDWTVFLEIQCGTIKQAQHIEAHIKKMKSKIYIKNLNSYPEMIQKLLEKYNE